jgi:hypothetical protein
MIDMKNRRLNMKSAAALTLAILMSLASFPTSAQEAKTAIMYKPLQCGCCDDYAKYLEQNGFKIKVESLPEQPLDNVKRMAGVPQRLDGCHTLMVDGYVVEGLVPINTLNKLLNEKPQIKGISLPGMPVGAPGMPGRKAGSLIIYELSQGSVAPQEFSRE